MANSVASFELNILILMNKANNNKGQSKGNQKGKPRQNQGPMSAKYISNIPSQSQRVSAPVAKALKVKTNKPSMNTRPNGDCIVKHREYIAEVTGSNLYAVTGYAVNAGQTNTFPWLSKLARNYESYRFRKLDFVFETQSATSEVGTVLLSLDYDASDPSPTSKQIAMAYRGSVRTAPWSSCVHSSLLEDLCKRKTYYTRSAALLANEDVKLYDVGNLYVSTQGQVATPLIGELYVEYDVLLMTPEFSPSEIVGGSVVGGGTMSGTNPLGSVPVLDADSIGISINGGSILTIEQPGDYVLTYFFTGTVITVAPLAQTLGAGVTLINPTVSVIEAGSLNAMVRSEVRVAASSGGQTIDISLTATTITASRLDVGVVPALSLA